jgi:hypothetical protein
MPTSETGLIVEDAIGNGRLCMMLYEACSFDRVLGHSLNHRAEAEEAAQRLYPGNIDLVC